jgi:hypothetical protein
VFENALSAEIEMEAETIVNHKLTAMTATINGDTEIQDQVIEGRKGLMEGSKALIDSEGRL